MQSSVYRQSEFKGSHTDAEKSAQNKEACSYFAFQFNISQNWQHVASLSPRSVPPTWLLAALADIFRRSKGSDLAEKLGISITRSLRYLHTQKNHMSCSSSPFPGAPRPPASPPLSPLTPLWCPRRGDLSDVASVCFCFSWNPNSTLLFPVRGRLPAEGRLL